MRSKQTGVTLIGWIFLMIPVAIVVYSVIRLTPVYLNYMSVARSLEQVANEFKDDNTGSQASIRTAIEKHLNVEGVVYPDVKDIKITRDGRQWTAAADYDDQVPLFKNIFILVQFNKSVTLGSAASGS